MKFKVSIIPEKTKGSCHSKKQLADAVKKAADLWSSGKKEEAAGILAELFQDECLPEASLFTPYIRKLGIEYCNLIIKLYFLNLEQEENVDDDPETLWEFFEFMEECQGKSLFHELSAKIVDEKWNDVREKFYDKCPECMFMGEAEEPYSLKLRSPSTVECIPEGIGLHELSGLEYMDGYSKYEGSALVKDDPDSERKYPEKIQKLLKKIKAGGRKHFPNLIFPLTNGRNILETCDQMLELLDLLDHGYHFENVSTYITNHPKLFPDLMKQRMRILQALSDSDKDETDETEDDDDFFDDLDIKLEDSPEEKPKKKRSNRKKK